MINRLWHKIGSTSIRRQLIAGVALVHMLLMTVFVFDLVHRQREFLMERARLHVRSQAELLAANSLHGTISNDLSGLSEILDALRKDRYMSRVMVTTPNGRVLAHTDKTKIGLFRNDRKTAAVLRGPARVVKVYEGSTSLESAAPILVQGRVVGWAWVADDITADRIHLMYVTNAGLIYTAMAILIGTIFAIILASTVTGPLRLLLAGTKRLARNQLDQPILIKSGNEIGQLAHAFNEAMQKLAQQQSELRELEAHKREFYQRTIMAATDGKLIIAEKQDIEGIVCDTIGSWSVHDSESFIKMRDEVSQLALESGMEESRMHQFLGCVVEAAGNATKHANGGEARLCRDEDALIFAISDTGPGIGALALPDVALTRHYSTAGTLGMGYKLMIKFSDRVYLSTGPEGTTVAIEMRLRG